MLLLVLLSLSSLFSPLPTTHCVPHAFRMRAVCGHTTVRNVSSESSLPSSSRANSAALFYKRIAYQTMFFGGARTNFSAASSLNDYLNCVEKLNKHIRCSCHFKNNVHKLNSNAIISTELNTPML